MNRIIGIDFDNTIVSYDSLFHREAVRLGLISREIPVNKTSVRDEIRTRHDDIAWQKLQGRIYGQLMEAAEIIPGVEEFLKLCKKKGEKIFIVSHKTEFARYDVSGTNLRKAAIQWMAQRGLFTEDKFRLTRHDVFFESTRQEKINRIFQLGCHIFIDDLPEVLLDSAFDYPIKKILFSPGSGVKQSQLTVCGTWREIADHVFAHTGAV